MVLVKAKDRVVTTGVAYALTPPQDLLVGNGIVVGSRDDDAIVGNSANQMVTVAGMVFARETGVQLGDDRAADANCILNVAATGIVSGNVGASMTGTKFRVDNDGTITGSEAGLVISADGPGVSRIFNDGVISGGFTAILRAGFDPTGQKVIIINTGKIVCPSAFRGDFSDAVDVFVNRGIIRGEVFTTGGNDVFDNRRGTLFEGAYLGSGSDRYLPGMKAETADGEAGADRDVLDFRTMGAVKVALDNSLNGTGAARNDTYSGFEDVWGSNRGNDLLRGSFDSNRLKGNGGNDSCRALTVLTS